MANGVYQRSLTTDDCKLACIATSGCIGIDIYVPSGSVLYCYLLFTSVPLTAAPNFYHYDLQLNPNCVTVSEYNLSRFYNGQWNVGTLSYVIKTVRIHATDSEQVLS
jgi:hypothetical protein